MWRLAAHQPSMRKGQKAPALTPVGTSAHSMAAPGPARMPWWGRGGQRGSSEGGSSSWALKSARAEFQYELHCILVI